MGVIPQQVAQLGQADAGGFRQRGRIGEILRIGANALRQPIEQSDVLVLALVEKIGAAALAGAQAGGLGLGFGREDADIFRLGRARRTGRQANRCRWSAPR